MKLTGETQGPVKQFHATMTGQGEDLSKVLLIGELLTRCLKAVLRKHSVIIGDRVFQAVEAQVQRANDRMVTVRPEKAGRPHHHLGLAFTGRWKPLEGLSEGK